MTINVTKAKIQNRIRCFNVSIIYCSVRVSPNIPMFLYKMFARLFLLVSSLVVSAISSSLSHELAECISPIDEKTLVCMIDLLTRKGYSISDLEEAMIGRPEIEEREIFVQGVTMKAWKYLPSFDDRPSIVLLPGMTGHQVILKELAKALIPRFNVFTIDSLGYGESTGILPSDMMQAAVESVEKLMNEFGLEDTQTIVAGHSLGGIIAQNFALEHPSLKGVVNIDGGMFDVSHIDVEDAGEIEQERMMARMALFRTNPQILYMASETMQKLIGYIRSEIEGTSTAWHTWLDTWYSSGEWDRSFVLIESPMLVVKAVKTDSSTEDVQQILQQRFNSGRPSSSPSVRVATVVTTHEQIVLLRNTIDTIVTLIE